MTSVRAAERSLEIQRGRLRLGEISYLALLSPRLPDWGVIHPELHTCLASNDER